MIVVDSSVIASALLSFTESHVRLRDTLAQQEIAAPGHVNLEVMSVFRRYCRRGTVTEERLAMALFDLREFSIERVPTAALEPRIWELRHNLTTYDAAYVALAERLGVEFWTLDRKLAGAPGTECAIKVPESG